MNRVLIIAPASEVIRTVSRALPKEAAVESSDQIQKAIKIHKQNPFSLIFIELQLLKAKGATYDFTQLALLFKKANPILQIVVLSAKSSIRDAVHMVKAGADDYLTYPIDAEKVRLIFESVKKTTLKNLELDYLRDQFWKTEWLHVIKSRNPAMRKVFENIRAVAPTIATVLLHGETGTGKGLIARLIHRHSLRHDKPFIAVHCGAIPDTLLESELFGHEKGAFTGAVQKKLGKFEMAHGGTIFLDEIGTISAAAQIKLLQALQDGSFSRVGGEHLLKTDARVIAVTNSDLKQLCEEGRFRKDLYFRLNIFPVDIPPLRDRLEDLSNLIELFLENLNLRYSKNIHRLHPSLNEVLKAYDWPGNVRELENILERAYLLEKTDMLIPEHFPSEVLSRDCTVPIQLSNEELSLAEARSIALEKFEQLYIKNLIARNKGKIALSAAKANITPRQLNRLMARYGIRKEDYKD
ncbi:MAG: sigma-54-dependent Fis family transcriptional regulator [Anaerolineaceae bacterium]|nr:sigma-54-dependent Fis family transcriptional regulator [Anaerolineaceae bacterium]